MPVPRNFSSLPGEKLIDAELAECLAVSRTPIRKALREYRASKKTYFKNVSDSCGTAADHSVNLIAKGWI
jgi:DNA-binding FadR family transcriptional regulator